MAFTLEPVYRLYSYEFLIPSYQRGYRWDQTQVVALLNDLKTFINRKGDNNQSKGDIDDYCLQPIVALKVEDESFERGLDGPQEVETDKSDDVTGTGSSENVPQGISKHPEGTKFWIIDGQQRLTTISLLLAYLDKKRPCKRQIAISFDTREKQNEFLKDKKYIAANDPGEDYKKNIDNYYLRRAYDTIEKWFDNLSGFERDNLSDKINDLFSSPGDTTRTSSAVCIIWYELTGYDPIRTFNDLNYNRIKLTGTDLVKSMLLASVFSSEEGVIHRSHTWDRIEKSLQEPRFWSMLSKVEPSRKTNHIDIILDLVADEINREKPKDEQRSRAADEEMFNYYVIDAYFSRDGSQVSDISKNVTRIWDMIRKYYNHLRNWYDNPVWYHYIGLWRRLTSGDVFRAMLNLEKKAEGKGKKALEDALRKKVGELIKTCDVRDEEERNEVDGKTHPLDAKSLSYTDKPNLLRQLLLAANVIETMRSNSSDRFPFDLYDLYEQTSLEHIHPQNITFSHRAQDIKSWVLERIACLELLTDSDYATLANRRNKSLEVGDPVTVDDVRDRIERAADNLKKSIHDPFWDKEDKVNEGDEAWSSISGDVAELDRIFGDMAEISEVEKHSIANMALVDVATNASLSNHYLNTKRLKLEQRDKARVEWEQQGYHGATERAPDAMYLMPLTRRVFSKHYSSGSPGDMRFWRFEDRKNYLETLKNIYDYLTK